VVRSDPGCAHFAAASSLCLENLPRLSFSGRIPLACFRWYRGQSMLIQRLASMVSMGGENAVDFGCCAGTQLWN
jgi:hypothetical protein